MVSVMWFRRDLRLADNPALLEACADGPVLPLFVLDPALWGPSGPVRRAYLGRSLRALADEVPLAVVRGDPVRRVVLAAREAGADRVHVAADFGPYGRARDEAVERALADAGIELVRTGSPYAVPPGSVTTGADEVYKVFTPYSRAWGEHGWEQPIEPAAPPRVAGPRRHHRHPGPGAAEGSRAPQGGRGGAHCSGGAGSSTGSPTTTRRGTSPLSTAPPPCPST